MTVAEELALHGVHEGLGARFGEWADRLVPRHYGDPQAEYAAATTGAGVVDRSERVLVRLWGREPVKMVQGLVTSDVAGTPEGQGSYGALLTPKGKMIAEVRVFRLASDEMLLDADGLAGAGILEHLRKFVPPIFARHEDVSDRTGVLGVFGPGSREAVAAALGVDVPADLAEDAFITVPYGEDRGPEERVPGERGQEQQDPEQRVLAVHTRYAGVAGYDLIVPRAALERVWAALVEADARPVGHGTLEVLRVEAGRPRWGSDLDENVIPLEAGLRERAISETKGCYTGQEVIIRILHRGHVNRHLRRLFFGDSPALAKGASLVRPGEAKVIGTVTSACLSPRHGQTIGLGYVRREVEPPATLRLADAEDVEVRVEAL
jgi:folate-binding protein YgfZ